MTRARFGAALGVVLFHACISFGVRESWYGRLSQLGFVGVSFFFILSGFVLTWSSRPHDDPRKFYWRRFARIWPIYALTWLMAILYAAVGHGTVLWKPVVLGFLLLQGWSSAYAMSYNFPAWSLSVEAFFYLLFPFLILVLRRLSRTGALIVVGLAYLWTVSGDVVVRIVGGAELIEKITYAFPPYRLGEFVAGMALAHALAKGWRPRVHPAVPMVLIGALALTNAWVTDTYTIDRDVMTLTFIPVACLLVIALAQRDLGRRQGGSAVLLRLGEASYALYISHALVIFAWGGLRIPFSSGYLPIYLIVSVAVALLLHLLVEKPAESWLRRHILSSSARRPAVVAVQDAEPARVTRGAAALSTGGGRRLGGPTKRRSDLR